LVSLYHTCDERIDQSALCVSMDDLKDYIMYAKGQFKPQLMEESSRSLAEAYLEMRKTSDHSARDVEEAKRLHKEAMKQSAVDPKTNRIDVTILTTGYSAENRRHRDEMATTLKKLIREKGELNAWSLL
jgi:DNA replication licensing factor MCM4